MNRFVQWFRRNPPAIVAAIAIVCGGTLLSILSLRPPMADAELSKPATETGAVADSSAVLSLAQHLKKVGAKMYGASWCPYCKQQQELFGDAFKQINYIECEPKETNARPDLCKAAKVTGYPTWDIKGKLYVGMQSLEELATASNYKGSRSF